MAVLRPSGSRSWSGRGRAFRVALVTVLLCLLGPGTAAMAAVPAASGRIAFVLDSRATGACCRLDIATMRPDGTGVRVLTDVGLGAFARNPSWSPDAKSIVFALDPSGPFQRSQIWRVNADGSGRRLLVADPFFIDLSPSYSPDGSRLVFTRCRPDFSACALYGVRSDGTHLTALLPFQTEIANFGAVYSPDGSRIALGSFSRGGIQGAVYVMRADGAGLHRVTPAWLGAAAPGWSPDGRRLVFSSNCCTPRTSAIWRVSADGGDLVQLTRSARHDSAPSYSPSGSQITFESSPPNFVGFAVWVMNSDGSNQHKVGRPFSGNPRWGPGR